MSKEHSNPDLTVKTAETLFHEPRSNPTHPEHGPKTALKQANGR
jgi:hypothetical protein